MPKGQVGAQIPSEKSRGAHRGLRGVPILRGSEKKCQSVAASFFAELCRFAREQRGEQDKGPKIAATAHGSRSTMPGVEVVEKGMLKVWDKLEWCELCLVCGIDPSRIPTLLNLSPHFLDTHFRLLWSAWIHPVHRGHTGR